MTNEEHLQQAKDQVAKQYKDDDGDHYDTWRQFFNDQIREGYIDAVEEAYDRAALQAIQSAREEAAPKWVPVTERLPEIKRMVLVWAPGSGDARVAYLEYPKSHHGPLFEMGNHISANVTHWMPLPDKPKN